MLRQKINETFTDTELEQFMYQAIKAAKAAEKIDEVPIGAVIVDNQTKEIIASGFNRREKSQNALEHAEIIAINQACQKVGSWRLEKCSLFVTLEPCAMCAGAIINSRIEDVIFGAWDPKAGSVGSITNLFELNYNSKPDYQGGVFNPECAGLLQNFFRSIRRKKH